LLAANEITQLKGIVSTNEKRALRRVFLIIITAFLAEWKRRSGLLVIQLLFALMSCLKFAAVGQTGGRP
jgi:hypothetical protein